MPYVKKRETGVINRVYLYKLRPTPAQVLALESQLATQCYLYNNALRFRQQMYKAWSSNGQWTMDNGQLRIPDVFTPGEGRVPEPGQVYLSDVATVAGIREKDLFEAYEKRGRDAIDDLVPAVTAAIALAVEITNKGHVSHGDLKKRFITAPRKEGHPYLLAANYGLCARTLTRLEHMYQAFWRRLKAGENPGDMHFKSPARWDCLEYDSYGNGCKFAHGEHFVQCGPCAGKGYFDVTTKPCRACQGRAAAKCPLCHGTGMTTDIPVALKHYLDNLKDVTLRLGRHTCPQCEGRCHRACPQARAVLQGIGEVKVLDLYRPIPNDTAIRNMSVLRRPDGWYVALSLEIPFTPPTKPNRPAVGLDFGLKDFITASDNQRWPVPRYMANAEAELSERQLKISGQVKGSKRRRASVRLLAKAHLRVRNARQTWHRVVAKQISLTYGEVYYEKLSPKKLARRPAPIPAGGTIPGEVGAYDPNGATRQARRNMAFHDAAISSFVPALVSACERAGVPAAPVAPDAQSCSECGRTPSDLSDSQEFRCNHCGNTISRRFNSARNALRAGQAVPAP